MVSLQAQKRTIPTNVSTCSGVGLTKEKGDICPDFFGAKLSSECYVINTNCKMSADMLIIMHYRMSNASGCYVVVKSHQDHQG